MRAGTNVGSLLCWVCPGGLPSTVFVDEHEGSIHRFMRVSVLSVVSIGHTQKGEIEVWGPGGKHRNIGTGMTIFLDWLFSNM